MIRLLARFWARKQYVWKEEAQAAVLDLNASAALYRAEERRKAVKQMNTDADGIEANIKQVDERMEKGFWQCECGNEEPFSTAFAGIEHELSRKCGACQKDMKRVRTDIMTGQEKYESDKERKQAVQMAEANRVEAKKLEDEIKGNEDAAAMFKKQAKQARDFAELLRKL